VAFHVKLGFRTSIFLYLEGSTLKHNYVKTNECKPMPSAAKI